MGMDETRDQLEDAQLARHLLRGGVGRRHVRRALRELADHREDLVRQMTSAGHERTAALREARHVLGDRALLAAQMIARPELQSRARRFAWLLFGLAPLPQCVGAGILVMLAGAAVLELAGLLGAPVVPGRLLMAISRPLLLWIVPCCVGLLLCWLAVRHWVGVAWPLCAMAIVAWCSGLTTVTENMIGFGSLPMFRSPLPEYLRIATLFGALGATYLWWRHSQMRSFINS
jgi:hypothetical protein